MATTVGTPSGPSDRRDGHTVAERLRRHPWRLSIATLTVVVIVAALVSVQDASPLWVIAGAIGAGSMGILVAVHGRVYKGAAKPFRAIAAFLVDVEEVLSARTQPRTERRRASAD